jgi:hypothetical protein
MSKTPATSDPEIGDKMPDGSIYVGISSISNVPVYAMPADATLAMTFNEAMQYADKLNAHGHEDWRLPSRGELNVLFNHRAAIGGFNPGVYWSVDQSYDDRVYTQRFSDGYVDYDGHRDARMSVRCVRSVWKL